MAEYDLESLSILIVEDNVHMRRLVQSILNALGVRMVGMAEDGADAFKVMKTFEPDIIICDWNMDPIDGLEFTKMIRTNEDSPNIYVPIIMLTGHTEARRVILARDAGVNEFLAKPISAKKLYQRIKAILESPRQFVRTPTYFGPNRRRRNDPNYTGPERRKPAKT